MTAERYRIVKKLGEGGRGRTYLVRDRKLGKLWAMKEWTEECGAQEEFTILRELDSPCFPRIVECFQENGRQYLIMDWIRGMTLEERLMQDGPLAWRTAASYALRLCGALEVLHGGEPAILHLDLKPSNIILTQDGPRLIDFGSAVLAKTGEEETERIFSGTPGFAAPELEEERRADVRSDIYGLGAVLWVMLTGKKREKGGEPGERPEGIPDALWEILRRALKQDRRERFADAGEMKRALEELLEQKEGGDGRNKRRWPVLSAAVLLAVLMSLAAALGPAAFPQDRAAAGEGSRAESVHKEALCSGKRMEAFLKGSVWRLVWQEEKGTLLGMRHYLGEALRNVMDGEKKLSKKADGFRGRSAGF
ncbi:MAG TPA: serine/threonine protein kinase [Candidatus Eisenbergiella intestinipullorum]|nr:serine/threonine protein kinase [Candidatus Eisenbergiella intestinipullorum]